MTAAGAERGAPQGDRMASVIAVLQIIVLQRMGCVLFDLRGAVPHWCMLECRISEYSYIVLCQDWLAVAEAWRIYSSALHIVEEPLHALFKVPARKFGMNNDKDTNS